MANNSLRIRRFIDEVRTTFVEQPAVDNAIARELRNVVSLLESIPPLTGKFPKSTHGILRHAEGTLKVGTSPLLASLAPIIEYLPWRYSYPMRPDAPALGERIAFAEVVGPEAPFRSGSVCLGLTLIAPETLYPEHRHPAVELYYVLAGTASWRLNGVAREYAPGSYILHPSQAVHAMQTNRQPLLAIYSWSGPDIRTASVYTDSIHTKLTK